MPQDKVSLSAEEIKPVAISIVELCLVEGISVSQLVENLLEGLRVDLNIFLRLAMPNQYYQPVCEAGFWAIFWAKTPNTSMIPNIQLLPYCMIL